MNRLERAVVLAELVEKLNEDGSRSDEIQLQKVVYLMQSFEDVQTGYDFSLYKHAPFSFDLRDEITGFRADNLFNIEYMTSPHVPCLRAKDLPQILREKYSSTREAYSQNIASIAGLVKNKSIVELELLATAVFFTLDGRQDLPASDRAEAINSFRPHITFEVALDAVNRVDEIREEANATSH